MARATPFRLEESKFFTLGATGGIGRMRDDYYMRGGDEMIQFDEMMIMYIVCATWNAVQCFALSIICN